MTFEEWWDENEFEWVSRKDMAKAAWGSSQLNLRELLAQAFPHVKASAGAEKMLDGFKPKRHAIDDLVDQIEEALK